TAGYYSAKVSRAIYPDVHTSPLDKCAPEQSAVQTCDSGRVSRNSQYARSACTSARTGFREAEVRRKGENYCATKLRPNGTGARSTQSEPISPSRTNVRQSMVTCRVPS